MEDLDYLYIFFHIPKCAGSSFIKTIEKNFKSEELLYLDFGDWRMDPDLGKSYKDYLQRASNYFQRFSEKEKSRIKIIYGHTVPWGIHKNFKRKSRYFTFVRKPEKRVVSMYNFFRFRYEKETPIGRKRDAFYTQLLIDGKIPKFYRWVKEKYGKKENVTDTMCGCLKNYGYIKGKINKSSIKKALEKFYFVGLVKSFDEDSSFIFQKLGVKKLLGKYNVSYKYFDEPAKIKNNLIVNDKTLIKLASDKNQKFKEEERNFYQNVKNIRRKKVFIPFNRIIFDTEEAFIWISDSLRRKSRLYFRVFNYIRGKPLE